MHAGSIEQTENAWQLWYDNTFPLTYRISHSASSRTPKEAGRKKRRAVWESEYEREKTTNVREEQKCFQEVSQSCATLQWVPTPVGRTEVLLRKEITSLLGRRHFNCFVVSRSHLGVAEVESSAGTSKDKRTSLETRKFSSSTCSINCVSGEEYLLPAIGSFLSSICVIHLLSLTLCTPAVLIFSMDKYFIGWFPFFSRRLSPCHKGWNKETTGVFLEHQSQYIRIRILDIHISNILYHHALFAYVSESFVLVQVPF